MFRNDLFPDSTNATAKPHPHRHTHAQMGAHIRTFKVQIERMPSSSLHVLLACPLILHISAISFTLIWFCVYSIITPTKKIRHSVVSCCDVQISCKTHLPVNLYHEFQPAHSSLFFLFFPSVCISKSASKEGTVWTALVYRQLWETVCWYLCLWKTKAHLQHALRMNLPQSMNSFLNISPLKILMGTWKKQEPPKIVTKKDTQERICSHHNIEKKTTFLSSDLT